MSAIRRGLPAAAQKRSSKRSKRSRSHWGVTETMAHALVVSCDPFRQWDVIRQYGERLTQRERTDLARCIQPYDPDEVEEALG
jgi:hypothetical protein